MVKETLPPEGHKHNDDKVSSVYQIRLHDEHYVRVPNFNGLLERTQDEKDRREMNYAVSKKTMFANQWFAYTIFGILEFEDPRVWHRHYKCDRLEEKHLRTINYLQLMNETDDEAHIDLVLEVRDVAIPYLEQHSPDLLNDTVEALKTLVDIFNQKFKLDESMEPDDEFDESVFDHNKNPPHDSTVNDSEKESTPSPTLESTESTDTTIESKDSAMTLESTIKTTSQTTASVSSAFEVNSTQESLEQTKQSTTVRNDGFIRLETRFAPKDLENVARATSEFHNRLLPVFKKFHEYVGIEVMDWQTTLPLSNSLELKDVSNILSIKTTPSRRDKAFYFSFRVRSTGAMLTKAFRSHDFMKMKKDLHINFETSNVSSKSGAVTPIGDIHCKDAMLTHRGHYHDFVKAKFLPDVDIEFDVKIRHKDPTGSKEPMIIIKCGFNHASQLAEILCKKMTGEGTTPEIFISRYGLGASKLTSSDLDRLYATHKSWKGNLEFVDFNVTRNIDAPRTEFLDDGTEISRSPREWARSLSDSDGTVLGIDLDNGGRAGKAFLQVPRQHVAATKTALAEYRRQQNPRMEAAKSFYTELKKQASEIPESVFTDNIRKLLKREVVEKAAPPKNMWEKPPANQGIETQVSSLTSASTNASSISTKEAKANKRKELQDRVGKVMADSQAAAVKLAKLMMKAPPKLEDENESGLPEEQTQPKETAKKQSEFPEPTTVPEQPISKEPKEGATQSSAKEPLTTADEIESPTETEDAEFKMLSSLKNEQAPEHWDDDEYYDNDDVMDNILGTQPYSPQRSNQPSDDSVESKAKRKASPTTPEPAQRQRSRQPDGRQPHDKTC